MKLKQMRKMKLYVHVDVDGTPVTCACNVSQSHVTCAKFKQMIKHRLEDEIPGIKSCSLKLFMKNATELHCFDDISIRKFVHHNDEMFATVERIAEPTTTKPKPSEMKSVKPKVSSQEKTEDGEKSTVQTSSTDDGGPTKTLGEWIESANGWLEINQANKAVGIYNALVETNCATDDIYTSIIQIYLDADRPNVALEYVTKAKKMFPKNLIFLIREGDCYLALNNIIKASEALGEAATQIGTSKQESHVLKHAMDMSMFKLYQLNNQPDMALLLIRQVARADPESKPAMLELVKLTYDLNDSPTSRDHCAAILLADLVKNRGDRYKQRRVAELCLKPDGLKHLLSATRDGASNALVLGYLSVVLRSNGAVEESIKLLEMAPNHSQVFLEHIHMLVLLNRYDEVVQRLILFLERFPSLSVGTITNKQVLECVEDLKDSTVDLNVTSAAESKEAPMEHGYALMCKKDFKTLLAVWFTLVKVLYIRGTLSVLPALVTIIDQQYKDNQFNLTIIANEAAFYGCISKVVSTWKADDTSSSYDVPVIAFNSAYVYVMGDSHCVSPAWRSIQYKEVPHVLHPVLSTGTKIWHLRSEGVFYTKHNFYTSISRIPDGSTVIFNLGEIDCRYSLQRCVEMCRYETIEEGIAVLLEIYVTVLKELHEKHKYTIYVHPVPPVIDITRPTVMGFNSMLKMRLEGEADLCYLDILSELCDDKGNLRKTMEFDGTHLPPDYTSVLEKRL